MSIMIRSPLLSILCTGFKHDEEPPKTAERLRQLARSILKKCHSEEIVQHSAQWRLVDARPYGPLYVLEALWQRLGLADIIADQLKGRKLDFAVERALFAMVANRACAPCSTLYCYEQWLLRGRSP